MDEQIQKIETAAPAEIPTVEQNQVAKNNQTMQIAGAIIIAGVLIAGAILLKGTTSSSTTQNALTKLDLAPVTANDRTIGSENAKLTLVLYEDFQCPFCGKFFSEVEKPLENAYTANGTLRIVYRDFPFLGPESFHAAEAARCAEDQGKFWEYHDYLFSHQNGENQGAFSDSHLKTFAKEVGLDTTNFNTCLDTGKYTQAITDSKDEAAKAGVTGTPKGFIIANKNISSKTQKEIIAALKLPPNSPEPISFFDKKNVLSLNGALPYSMVQGTIDILLK